VQAVLRSVSNRLSALFFFVLFCTIELEGRAWGTRENSLVTVQADGTTERRREGEGREMHRRRDVKGKMCNWDEVLLVLMHNSTLSDCNTSERGKCI
jgi:hypothetical protein